LDLAELAHVANTLPLEGAEVSGDARLLEINDAGKWLIKQAADGEDWEVTSLGLK
jgi:hypothetical protein